MPAPGTLPELLERAARLRPERGVGIFDRRARSCTRRTYPEIVEAARANAARWARLGVQEREPVLACLPTSWELLDAWLGALFRGAWPVAVAPGGALGQSSSRAGQLDALVQRLGASRFVCDERLRTELRAAGAETAASAAITPEELAATDALSPFEMPRAEPEDTAFLQLTSGSTGQRRAVVIPHRAIVANVQASDEAIGAPHGTRASDRVDAMVSWLPLYHDMGLVGGPCFCAWCGIDLWMLPPEAFLARPHLWLSELGRAGRTIAPAPNFAFQLCTERAKWDELRDVSLAGWDAALIGAEMIRPETIASFLEATGDLGFAPETFRPCYGLAEGTLAVTFDERGEGVRTRPVPGGVAAGAADAGEVVCVGRPVRDTEIVVARADGQALPEGTVGEVRVRGPGVFAGYHLDDEGTAESLQDGWLLTGDVGFLHDGELHVTGRKKELLVIRGENVMPHELEWIADGVAGAGGAQRSGAFSVDQGAQGEVAVVVMECVETGRDHLGRLEADVRRRVGRELSLTLADLVFVKRGAIPKTTSGKVRRSELRRLYLEGELGRLPTGE